MPNTFYVSCGKALRACEISVNGFFLQGPQRYDYSSCRYGGPSIKLSSHGADTRVALPAQSSALRNLPGNLSN